MLFLDDRPGLDLQLREFIEDGGLKRGGTPANNGGT